MTDKQEDSSWNENGKTKNRIPGQQGQEKDGLLENNCQQAHKIEMEKVGVGYDRSHDSCSVLASVFVLRERFSAARDQLSQLMTRQQAQ